jgi:hypothetical protein
MTEAAIFTISRIIGYGKIRPLANQACGQLPKLKPIVEF